MGLGSPARSAMLGGDLPAHRFSLLALQKFSCHVARSVPSLSCNATGQVRLDTTAAAIESLKERLHDKDK